MATNAPNNRCQRSGSSGNIQCAKIMPKIGIDAWMTAANPDETCSSAQKRSV